MLEDTEAEILPEEYITSPNITENDGDGLSECCEVERNHGHEVGCHLGDEVSYQEEVSVSDSLKEHMRMTGGGYQDISFDSNGRDAAELLAQLACSEAEGSVSTFQELQMLLASKDQASFQSKYFIYFMIFVVCSTYILFTQTVRFIIKCSIYCSCPPM